MESVGLFLTPKEKNKNNMAGVEVFMKLDLLNLKNLYS